MAPPDSTKGSQQMGKSGVSCRTLALLLYSFGGVLFGATALVTILLDTLMVDLTGVIALCFADPVRHGRPWARKWSLFLMGYYVLVAGAMVVGCIVAPSRIKAGGRDMSPGELRYALPFCAVIGIWALVNFVLFWRSKAAFHKPASSEASGVAE
jgi:hypothetical protein